MFIDKYREELRENFIYYTIEGKVQDSFLCKFYRAEFEEDYRLRLRLWKIELKNKNIVHDIQSYYNDMLEYVRESVAVRNHKNSSKLFELLELDCSKGIEKAVNSKLRARDSIAYPSLCDAIELAIAIENNHRVSVKKDNPYILIREAYIDYELGEKKISEVLDIILEKFTSLKVDKKSGKTLRKMLPKIKVSPETAKKLEKTSAIRVSKVELEAIVKELQDAYLVVKANEFLYNVGCSPKKDAKKGRKKDPSLKMVSAFLDSRGISLDGNSFSTNSGNGHNVESKEFQLKCDSLYRKLEQEKKEDVCLPLHIDPSGVGIYILGRNKISFSEIVDKNPAKQDSCCYFVCLKQNYKQICEWTIVDIGCEIKDIMEPYNMSKSMNTRRLQQNNGMFPGIDDIEYQKYFA